jgi:outer membrane protein assembly factor BamB
MKPLYTGWTLGIALCIICAFSPAVHAQDDSFFDRPERGYEAPEERNPLFSPDAYHESDLFPDYEVEMLHRSDREQDIVFPLIYKGSLYSFSLHNGLPLWRIFIGGDLQNPFTATNRVVYFYDIYNRVYAIDLFRGEIIWKRAVYGEIAGKLNIYGKFIITSTLNGAIHFIDREDGAIRFTYQGEGEINAGLSIYQNLIIVPYRKGKVVAYDAQSRREAWSFNSGGLISVQPVIRDREVYFGSWDDTFYALDIATGKQLWSSYVGDAISRDFLVFRSSVLLFFSDGEMVCLSRNRGDIKWVKYFKGVEFSYNYFQGNERAYLFIPGFIALDPLDGEMLFDYRERSFFLYKEMLFDSMVEGEQPYSEADRMRLLSEVYFTVNSYPYLPPESVGNRFVYFITENGTLYVYDLERDFFRLKFTIP